MSVRVNVRMSNIVLTPIKLDVRTYATYANCRTLLSIAYNIQLKGEYFTKYHVVFKGKII